MSVDGPDSSLKAGSNASLVCTVTSGFTPSVKWVDPDNNQVLTTGTDVRTDDPVTVGNTTSLVLNFDLLRTSYGGNYTCISTLSEPYSFSSKRVTKYLQVKGIASYT